MRNTLESEQFERTPKMPNFRHNRLTREDNRLKASMKMMSQMNFSGMLTATGYRIEPHYESRKYQLIANLH